MAIRRVKGASLSDDTKTNSILDASGLPSNPQPVSSSAPDQENVVISWSSPTISGVSPVSGYSVTIVPSAPSATVNISGTSASISNLDADTTYDFIIRAQNSFGLGGFSPEQEQKTKAWNAATGGTVTNYSSGGYTWRAHLYTSNSTINVTSSETPFEVVGGGGGGGGGANTQGGHAGNGGTGVGGTSTAQIGTGSTAITIGGGGGGGTDIWGRGGTGGTSSVGSLFSRAGGGGGQGTTPQGGGGGGGSPNGPQVNNAYTGTNRNYSGGGGGGRQGHPDGPGSPGGAGSLAIRYKTGRA